MPSPTTSKPVYIIVPGLGHTPAHWSPFTSHLSTLGHEAITLAYPTQGPTPSSIPTTLSQHDEISALESLISKYADDQSRDVVLIAHSYGGIPMSRAATAFEKSVREKEGKKGGVSRLVFLSAAILPEGAGQPDFRPEWLGETDGAFKIKEAGVPVQFHDIPEKEQGKWVEETRWHRVGGGKEGKPQRRAVWGLPVPKTYIVTTGDQAWSAQIQLQQVEGVVDETWTIRTIGSGHNPFLSRPEELAKLVLKDEE